MKTNLPLYLALLLLTQCSKCKNDPTPADPASQLPPATQQGKNTFGCLVNGQPFTPKGNNGTPNFYVTYDPTFNNGDLIIAAYRIDRSREQSVTILAIGIQGPGVFSFMKPGGNCKSLYEDNASSIPCGQVLSDLNVVYRSGHLTITKFDTQSGIISGTFDLKLLKAGCDTLRITQGRFDAKF